MALKRPSPGSGETDQREKRPSLESPLLRLHPNILKVCLSYLTEYEDIQHARFVCRRFRDFVYQSVEVLDTGHDIVRVSPEFIQAVLQMTNLRRLDMLGGYLGKRVTERDFLRLAKLPKLRYLCFSEARIGRPFLHLHPDPRSLDLFICGDDDEGSIIAVGNRIVAETCNSYLKERDEYGLLLRLLIEDRPNAKLTLPSRVCKSFMDFLHARGKMFYLDVSYIHFDETEEDISWLQSLPEGIIDGLISSDKDGDDDISLLGNIFGCKAFSRMRKVKLTLKLSQARLIFKYCPGVKKYKIHVEESFSAEIFRDMLLKRPEAKVYLKFYKIPFLEGKADEYMNLFASDALIDLFAHFPVRLSVSFSWKDPYMEDPDDIRETLLSMQQQAKRLLAGAET